MLPCPTKNKTPTLAPDLNRGMTAGIDHVEDNMRDRGTSKALLETQEGKSHGNSMEAPRENCKLNCKGIDEKIHKDSKPTEVNLNP